jgi:hypothetical protein
LDFLKEILKAGRRADVKPVLEALELHRENADIRRLLEEAAARNE